MISAFDISKVGIGPSSSHIVRPMSASRSSIDLLVSNGELPKATHVVIDLYGSPSLTRRGRATGVAIMMGLAGDSPQDININSITGFAREVARTGRLPIAEGTHIVDFSPDKNILSHAEMLPRHENGMRITAWNDTETLLSETYYSAGGGFIVEEEQFGQAHDIEAYVPHNFHSASELLRLHERSGLSVSGLMIQNEPAMRNRKEIDAGSVAIWGVMHVGVERGMNTEGILPGPLDVPRRVVVLHRLLVSSDNPSSDPMNVIDWINMSALTVSEENAVGRRVVTTPTNSAYGIISVVLAYYDKLRRPVNTNFIACYLLAARAIGALYKVSTSILGAEVSYQGEIGVACSMAAAGLTELLGGSPSQVCIAAEIAMKYSLGPTCGPVAEQVQIPCIKRNAINVVRAANAAHVALRRISEPHVSLDKVIEVMYETGRDMNDKYREISHSDLAIKVVCT